MADLSNASPSTGLAGPNLDVSRLLAEIRARSDADGVPTMSASTIRVAQMLAALIPARRVFEIGTGCGLSALAVALAGRAEHLFTVERLAPRATVARAFAERAGLAARVTVMVGEGARLVHKVSGPFDLVVQDGDPAVRATVLDRLVTLLRPGGVLLSHHVPAADDAAPGSAADLATDHAAAVAHAAYRERLATDPRLFTTFLPVGEGLAVSIRTECTP